MEQEERAFKFDPRNLSVSVEKSRLDIVLTAPLKTIVDFLHGRAGLRHLGSLGEAFIHL